MGANPVATEETPTNISPAVAARRSPYRSTIGPATRSKTSRVNAKEEINSPAAS